MFRPDSIDGFLEGRSILNYLSPETYVQWMAYGALFPLQAKDLLLVTTVEPWDKKKTSRGFVIASTSIDSMCEISTAKPQKLSPPKLSSAQSLKRDSLSSSSGGEGTPKGKYIRANLRLGGYIGIPNEDGSTSLTFLVDMPLLSAQKSSAWMMRYLAQYSLTELVGRIRHAVSPFNIGTATDRSSPSSSSSLLFPSAAEGTDTEAAVAESGVGEERVGTMSPGRVAAISEGAPRSPGNFLGGGGTRTVDLGRMLAGIQRRELGVHKRCNTVERVPVPHHRRDRNNSVEYFNPAEETAAGESRSRLDSDQSVGYSTWKEVRSRANSAVSPHPTSGLDSDSANDTPHSSSIGRMSANSPVPSPASAPPPLSPRSSSHHHHQRHRHHQQQPGLALHAPDGIASAASPTTQVKEKSRSTFSMLKQSLSSKRSKHTRKAVTPTAATTLYMANIDDGDESDYKIGTPNSTPTSSPRPTVGHRKGVMSFPLKQGQGQGPSTPVSPYEEPSSPSPASFASIVPSRLRLSSRGDEEVDYGSVQRELGKISPARRPSKTMQAVQRRRSISQSQQQSVEGADPNATRSEMGGATSTRTTTSVPGHRRSLSSGDALRLVQGEAVVGNNSFVSAHLSQSINDLPAALEKHAHAELTHAAWGVYQTYFDPVRCREELGIDWQLKLNKPNIHIYSSMVSNNSWCAIKAVTVMRTTPMALVKVLLNYDRMGEYDAMFRKSQVSGVAKKYCFSF